VQQHLTSHLTYYRSFQRRSSSQSLDWCKRNKTNINMTKWHHKNRNKTTNICKTKLNETKALFSRLLCHPTRKWIGLIVQLPGPTWGQTEIISSINYNTNTSDGHSAGLAGWLVHARQPLEIAAELSLTGWMPTNSELLMSVQLWTHTERSTNR